MELNVSILSPSHPSSALKYAVATPKAVPGINAPEMPDPNRPPAPDKDPNPMNDPDSADKAEVSDEDEAPSDDGKGKAGA